MGNTNRKYCITCGANNHINVDHTLCKYCLNNHLTHEHICNKCNKTGHTMKDHCVYCDELHKNYEHICTICGIKGHQICKEKHIICKICSINKDKQQYTHHTDGHIAYIGLKNIPDEEYKKFKYCDNCKKICYTRNNKCIECSKNVPEIVKCSKKDCIYIEKNSAKKYCPFHATYLIKN